MEGKKMSISTISIRVDSELKRKAQQVFKKMGLNMTSAIELFLNNTVKDEELPLIPNKETIEALKEYEEMKNNPEKYKRYSSFKEAMKDVFEEENV